MESLGKTIIMIGILLIVTGTILFLGSKLGLGRLPGDIYYKKENFTFYFPVMTSIIASIVLTILLNLLFRR
ncbi:DUF2905 domain-containing protein [Geosporobacter ferrireducens]|uniref:DUF2905 domain-containing protein n=1 Tax=Geosporobacter ferrireducens TaxID=1424294 RepID=A0A1D8GPI2_9FIRM|nr:DUF2905 domain-containing protein [Geosporobacter ferrireducens]AOT72813.1 hypothetical protein Gferi_26600 [Geosporobacter ferrireducens]MTI55212.1 DUF2905 domain-containing protein [Geosporobacter ferrireducens]